MFDNLTKVSSFGFWYQLGFLVFVLWFVLGYQRYKARGDAFEAMFHTLSPEILRVTAIVVAVFSGVKILLWVLSAIL